MDPSTGAPVGGSAPVAAVLSTAYADQTLPAAAWGASTALVVWLEGENLYGSRLDGNTGTRIDTAPILIATTAQGYQPLVAFDGDNYLVAWTDQRGTYAERIRETDGNLLDGPPGSGGILVTNPLYDTSSRLLGLAYAGGNYLVEWNTFGTLVRASDGRLTPLEQSELVGQVVVVAGGTQSFLLAQLLGTGTGYALEYGQIQSDAQADGGGLGALQQVYAGNVPFTGTISPSIAFDGENFIVAYPFVTADPQKGVFTASQIDAIRVRESDGVMLDTVPIVVASTLDTSYLYHALIKVAYDGTNFVFAWADTRGGVYSARVGRGGTLLDGSPQANGVLLSASPVLPQMRSGPTLALSTFLDVVLSAGANGIGLETQARYLGDLGVGATRVVDRLVNWEDAGPPGPGSEAGGSCDGGGTLDASATDASAMDAGVSALEAGPTDATNGSPGGGGSSCSVGPARGAANGSLFGVLVAASAIRRYRSRRARKGASTVGSTLPA